MAFNPPVLKPNGESASNITKNSKLYRIPKWGKEYFSINSSGNIVVTPDRSSKPIDLLEVVKFLVKKGIRTPVILRFDGILRDRVRRLCNAFTNAIQEANYQNNYRPVYPIKVNPKKHITQIVKTAGASSLLGLEVGSKPELLAALDVCNSPGDLLLCNGFKDAEYIELAILANRMGRRTIIIVEQIHELSLILEVATKLNEEAEIGFRMKLQTQGNGKWMQSSGNGAKFGLNVSEIMQGIQFLKEKGKCCWLRLSHFHIGTQITNLNSIENALHESTRMFVEMAKLCPSLCFFDVGGGLAVDYDGTETTADFSSNYTIEEYAKRVVRAIQSTCDKAGVPHPTIISESGRAMVAHHSILITEVFNARSSFSVMPESESPPGEHEFLKELTSLEVTVTPENCVEILNQANRLHDTILQLFVEEKIGLSERARADSAYQNLLTRIELLSKGLKHIPKDLKLLNIKFTNKYLCNFSIFQSLPDTWAIQQIFPILPIHRLDEDPTIPATIADLTCDSDGKIDRFISANKTAKHIPLHELGKDPYYVGFFLVGAYQEVIGGQHNLFGNTNIVHIDTDENGQWMIKKEIAGNTMNRMLNDMQYDGTDLLEKIDASVDTALKEGSITLEESLLVKRRFNRALKGSTYMLVK
jgi:arginine decarboxylase